jgi:D-serine deaminase-like pyridoxal phosphate-dependent protein
MNNNSSEQLQDISTPSAIVDTQRMQRNIDHMQQRMNNFGLQFRPHVKTTKCIDIANSQIDAGAKGITVSTLKKAAALINKCYSLKLVCENSQAAADVAAFSQANKKGTVLSDDILPPRRLF